MCGMTRQSMDVDPYDNGWATYNAGKDQGECPWLPETDQALRWLMGWNDAHEAIQHAAYCDEGSNE